MVAPIHKLFTLLTGANKMPIFTVEITLGNDAMLTAEDVAAALRTIANKLETGNHKGRVMDVNGNTVGSYCLPEVC